MKKMMLFLGLMGVVVFTHAAEQKENGKTFPVEQGIKHEIVSLSDNNPDHSVNQDCTMSATMTVSVGVVKIEASCSASGADCQLALATAEGCVTAIIKRIVSAIK